MLKHVYGDVMLSVSEAYRRFQKWMYEPCSTYFRIIRIITLQSNATSQKFRFVRDFQNGENFIRIFLLCL